MFANKGVQGVHRCVQGVFMALLCSFTNSEKRIPKIFAIVYIMIILGVIVYCMMNL